MLSLLPFYVVSVMLLPGGAWSSTTAKAPVETIEDFLSDGEIEKLQGRFQGVRRNLREDGAKVNYGTLCKSKSSFKAVQEGKSQGYPLNALSDILSV